MACDEERIDLTEEDKDDLLLLARESIIQAVRGGRNVDDILADRVFDSPALRSSRGIFVTLRQHGRLRGCIGATRTDEPLYRAVVELAISSAVRDPRFPPLAKEEFAETNIEISVLSPFRRVADMEEVVVGRDGLYLHKGDRAGLLLPQVAVEYGWDREKFLEQCCQKAGLSTDEWKDDATEIMVFSALVFGEREDG